MSDDIDQTLEKLKLAARALADVCDGGERDPTWEETEALELAAINYGRAARIAPAAATPTRATRAGRRK